MRYSLLEHMSKETLYDIQHLLDASNRILSKQKITTLDIKNLSDYIRAVDELMSGECITLDDLVTAMTK